MIKHNRWAQQRRDNNLGESLQDYISELLNGNVDPTLAKPDVCPGTLRFSKLPKIVF